MSVLINGSSGPQFSVSRGIRQEDPMAPFLFLIVAEGLMGLVKSAINKELFIGFKVGLFTLKSFYSQQIGLGSVDDGALLKKCWLTCAPSKVCCFIWKLFRGRVATKEALAERNVCLGQHNLNCVFCLSHCEFLDHLFFTCNFAMDVWKHFYDWLLMPMRLSVNSADSLHYHDLHYIEVNCRDPWRMLWFSVIWSIWLMRNEAIFEGKRPNIRMIMELIKLRS
ncbi:PREDICTED: uncharacterized protein LOC109363518 [Lupinus angustifolius]|uniref:uncharacterized protein LOC109363518 n=1 Tax=Lupinus angustifolius TaxID=3871 RepID=UPI00092F1C18|nr:PREDICTED: uncharacterized protein LOC109363518 [Lupinus angustifolius]